MSPSQGEAIVKLFVGMIIGSPVVAAVIYALQMINDATTVSGPFSAVGQSLIPFAVTVLGLISFVGTAGLVMVALGLSE